jgi:spore maturation protein CgeB
MTGASNKPFDYLACGLPLLVSDRPDWRALFVDGAGGPLGRACDPGSAESLAAQLRWLHEHPEERRQMAARGRARILADWNYEAQFAKVADVLASRLA